MVSQSTSPLQWLRHLFNRKSHAALIQTAPFEPSAGGSRNEGAAGAATPETSGSGGAAGAAGAAKATPATREAKRQSRAILTRIGSPLFGGGFRLEGRRRLSTKSSAGRREKRAAGRRFPKSASFDRSGNLDLDLRSTALRLDGALHLQGEGRSLRLHFDPPKSVADQDARKSTLVVALEQARRQVEIVTEPEGGA